MFRNRGFIFRKIFVRKVWYNYLHTSGINSLVDGRVCSVPNRLPVDEPSVSEHVEDIVKIKILV